MWSAGSGLQLHTGVLPIRLNKTHANGHLILAIPRIAPDSLTTISDEIVNHLL